MHRQLRVRPATERDLDAIRAVYNEGIADRVATLDADPKDADDIAAWWAGHGGRYVVLVAAGDDGAVLGWASINRYSQRCAYDGVGDLSIYVARSARGTGVGSTLLPALEAVARDNHFHKIVLHALARNEPGRRLYRRCGYREVGTFEKQGLLDGAFVDVVVMEKLLVAG